MRFDRDDFGSNVEDSGRGRGGGFGGGGFGGGGGMLLGLIASRFGIGGVVVVVLLMVVFGGFGSIFGGGSGVVGGGGGGGSGMKTNAEACGQSGIHRFACNVNGSTERVWTELFAQAGQRYRPPTLRFFEQSVQSGCGAAQSAMGPFYCPSDNSIYLDTSFYTELQNRFGAAGDFAQAYVIAHEVGHHIQHLTGVLDQAQQSQRRLSSTEANAVQVQVELQADCYAGVWAARNRNRLEPGDVEEGMRAAEAIGDDALQMQAQGRVVPESFTHGTSAQRMAALRRGLETGDPAACRI